MLKDDFCRLSISYHYDDLFLNGPAGGNHDEAKHLIRGIINLAQPAFSDKEHWKLPSVVTLHEADLSHIPGQFNADRSESNM